MERKHGFANVPGGKIWYEIVGADKGIPLITLHGGPGYPHDYLEPLEDLADQRPVIFYDQLGCGNSDRPHDTSLWTVERFTAELGALINHLGLERYHILGHSWGSALAVSFALTKPKGLESLILTDPYISTPRWEADSIRLLKTLSKKSQETLEKAKRTPNPQSEEYKEAAKEFHDKFIRSASVVPEAVLRSRSKKSDEVYSHMWGPEEFWLDGNLKDYDPTKRLPEIKVPVLLLCGRFDEATPESAEYFQKLLPNAQFKVLEHSQHNPFWNERGEYMEIVQDFLQEAK